MTDDPKPKRHRSPNLTPEEKIAQLSEQVRVIRNRGLIKARDGIDDCAVKINLALGQLPRMPFPEEFSKASVAAGEAMGTMSRILHEMATEQPKENLK